ncbi:MAG: branched-chain amino acid ABC transporter permease [Rhodobacteraceae bacterium]|nr:branched-chain amino acid ABC transporter permease [Paracoccaceae bacterium]
MANTTNGSVIKWQHLLLWAIFLGGLALLPELADIKWIKRGTLRTFIFANYLAIFAMSWDVLSGRTGYISFGHPFLIGIGAYTTGILNVRFGVDPMFSIPIAVLVTMAAGTLFFLPALRISGSYFALITLAFMELIYQLVQVIRPDLTGGTRGISGVDTLMRGAANNYYLSLGLMGTIAILLWAMMRTRLGTALSAIGMNEEAVEGSGLNTTKLKLFAFMVGAAVAGVGGAFFAHYLGYVSPRGLFEITLAFTIIVSALLGGAGTIIGPIIGAIFLTFLLEILRVKFSTELTDAWPVLDWLETALKGQGRFFIYGLVALVIYMYQPKGIIEIVNRLLARIRGAKA